MSTGNKGFSKGFTLVEMVITLLTLGVVFIAFTSVFILFQKGSTQTTEFAEAQQNARLGVDYITDQLRQAGSGTDYFRGQLPIPHAGPYQIAINADIDNGQTIDGLAPLRAINRAYSPYQVPVSGGALYVPATTYQSGAETVVITLDSSDDGVISGSDRGDDPEERGPNVNLFVLKAVVYGDNGAGRNEVRESNLAIVRGPNLNPAWNVPQPIFQYFCDHDNDAGTADRLWGDGNSNGSLEDGEVVALTSIPQNLLSTIRKIRVTLQGESVTYSTKYETQGGFLSVRMNSEVYVRNARRTSSMVRGTVYHDANRNGVRDPGETGLPKVTVGLAGQGRTTLSDNFGMFYLPLPAGTYSLQEIDPPGYVSTTANTVSITLAAGETRVANFGDASITPLGKIKGTTYVDVDRNGVLDESDLGIPGVLISIDNGAQAFTDTAGFYSFIIPHGTYTVVETDPTGYSSTTNNSMTVCIAPGSDTAVVDFGNYAGPTTGTLEGYVYLDENQDEVWNSGEEGLPNVTVRVSSGDSTTTNAQGYYNFALIPGSYSVIEIDPDGYTSTTPNVLAGIQIATDGLVVRNFGDMLEHTFDFVEINIARTDRALSVSAFDLKEDSKNDKDILLGTALSEEVGNMLVFLDKWQTSSTPISELFDPDPTYRRDGRHNINTISNYDFSGDGTTDILIGLDYSTGPNVEIWHTGTGGILSTSADASYLAEGTHIVLDSKTADFDRDGRIDFVVGLKDGLGIFTGGLEIFGRESDGSFSSRQLITTAGESGAIHLGEIWAVETGDIDNDGDDDIVVGSHTGDYTGCIDIYRNDGYASSTFSWCARYRTGAAVNDVKVVDMKEDDGDDADILAAVSTRASAGGTLLWLNTAGAFGLPDTTAFGFEPSETPNWPDDWCDTGGEALCLGILQVNRDLFPDVAVGTRSSIAYTGDVYILPAYGTLPPGGIGINTTNSGEVITMDVADFNKDSRPDIVVGTRDSATHGILVIYFGTD